MVPPMSSLPARGPLRPDPWSDPRLRVPSAEAWAAMSEAERVDEEERIVGVLDEYREAMSEGTPHSRPKINAYKDLGDHFGRAGRRVFLATELCVLYPGQSAIVPDLLAVMDVADPERDRNTWRVIDEGRGIDLVLEFRNMGKKHKDLVENVKDYAQLGIAEYFSFDCQSTRLRGWRLASPGARTYTQMVPQGGVFPSLVLDLELGVAEGRLRFFKNLAQIPTSEELVERLQKMTDAYQDQLEQAERQRLDAVHRLESARVGLAELLLRRLAERGLAVTEEQRAQVTACEDFDRLLRWMERASSAATTEDALSA
jgi:Uma2 family endonuclease